MLIAQACISYKFNGASLDYNKYKTVSFYSQVKNSTPHNRCAKTTKDKQQCRKRKIYHLKAFSGESRHRGFDFDRGKYCN